ncbi:unnamed protein product [Gongylonema pulchrum]|uniref:Ashwin n=1 Tax=Gongylonema pulchrum TaxID=637853 RepID=A0A183EX02_9BILA|nr:unnamed protein product [Gongylonema pulchrum]
MFVEYRNWASCEKFLLMAVETDSQTAEDFAKVWKNSSKETKVEHRLKCRLASDNGLSTPAVNSTAVNQATRSNSEHAVNTVT